MKSSFLIPFTQKGSALAFYLISTLRSLRKGKISSISSVQSINHFAVDIPKEKSVLLILSAGAWEAALSRFPNIRLFNYYGITYHMVKALNEAGYMVDIRDMDLTTPLERTYGLIIAHGGKCAPLIANADEKTIVISYLSGANCGLFETESKQRYESYQKRRGIRLQGEFVRSYGDETEGFNYVCARSNHFFSIDCPRMLDSYRHYPGTIHDTGLGSYLDPVFVEASFLRNFTNCRKNFVCVSATGGNIQKGLDVIIDAFSRNPDLHLYIYCKVESEVLEHSAREINGRNIHYIYHHRYAAGFFNLKKTIGNIAFSITAPINTGIGTAYSASLGTGLIPVGYIDYCGDKAGAVISDHWDVDAMSACIRTASEKSTEWCKSASKLAIAYWEANCDPEVFERRFKGMIEEIESNSVPHH